MSGLTLTERLRRPVRELEFRALPAPVRKAAVRCLMPDPYATCPTLPDGRSLIFVHVPKTAGTSLCTALGIRLAHVPASRYRDSDPARYAAGLKAAFVRNPWRRMLSAFHYLRGSVGINNSRDARWAAANLTEFADFPSFAAALEDPDVAARILRYVHFRPQIDWLRIPGRNAHDLDFVGRFESLAEDAARLFEMIGCDATLEHRRAGPRAHSWDEYTPAAAAAVARLYAEDVALLGYESEGPAAA